MLGNYGVIPFLHRTAFQQDGPIASETQQKYEPKKRALFLNSFFSIIYLSLSGGIRHFFGRGVRRKKQKK